MKIFRGWFDPVKLLCSKLTEKKHNKNKQTNKQKPKPKPKPNQTNTKPNQNMGYSHLGPTFQHHLYIAINPSPAHSHPPRHAKVQSQRRRYRRRHPSERRQTQAVRFCCGWDSGFQWKVRVFRVFFVAQMNPPLMLDHQLKLQLMDWLVGLGWLVVWIPTGSPKMKGIVTTGPQTNNWPLADWGLKYKKTAFKFQWQGGEGGGFLLDLLQIFMANISSTLPETNISLWKWRIGKTINFPFGTASWQVLQYERIIVGCFFLQTKTWGGNEMDCFLFCWSSWHDGWFQFQFQTYVLGKCHMKRCFFLRFLNFTCFNFHKAWKMQANPRSSKGFRSFLCVFCCVGAVWIQKSWLLNPPPLTYVTYPPEIAGVPYDQGLLQNPLSIGLPLIRPAIR